MAKTMKVEVILPEKTQISTEAEFLTIPGESGELGILPEHTRLIASLRPGNMRIDNGASKKSYVISAGVALIEPKKVKILVTLIRHV